MQLQQLYSYVRRAVDDYHMIEEGDRIAVGLSGGKDSFAMLYALSGLQKFYPVHFELQAITVNLGFLEFNTDYMRSVCDELSVPYTVLDTNIGEVVFDVRHEHNPCALCAKMRKGSLNNEAIRLGCNKIAYGHHRDDLIDTFMLSLIYEGRLHSYQPVTYLDRTNLTLIRPLMYLREADIIGFRNKYQIPICKNPCPADGVTRRQYVKDLVRQIDAENPGVKDRLFRAIIDGHLPGWPTEK